MHCRRIDNLRRMEGECENSQSRNNKKEGFYTVLRIDFHSCVLVWLSGTSVDLIYINCNQNMENVNVQM